MIKQVGHHSWDFNAETQKFILKSSLQYIQYNADVQVHGVSSKDFKLFELHVPSH